MSVAESTHPMMVAKAKKRVTIRILRSLLYAAGQNFDWMPVVVCGGREGVQLNHPLPFGRNSAKSPLACVTLFF